MGGSSDPVASSISIVIVIVAVVIVEKIFHLLHRLTVDTAFSNMIVRIEKELMIVGSTAFIFKLALDPGTDNWSNALHFADLIVPIFSFCFCGIGVLLIVSSLRQCNVWSKAYRLHMLGILDEFLTESNKLYFRLSWKPLNSIISKVEFRIFHALFCDFFQLKPNAFAFDEYVARVYEKYVFSIIKIEVVHWMILSAIVLLNLLRVALDLQYQHCGAHDVSCQQLNDIVIFTIAGAVLYAISAILVYVSRNLEMKIMAKKSITSYKSYNAFLSSLNETNRNIIGERLDEQSLKEIIQRAKMKEHTAKLDEEDLMGE